MARTYNIEPKKEEKQTEVLPARSQKWKVVLPTVLVAGVVISGAAFGVLRLQEHREDVAITKTWDEMKGVADAVQEPADGTEETAALERGQMYSSDPMKREINWDGVLAVNPDIRCWIYIPETEIDYPVLQPEKWADNQYYLNHDVYGNISSAGSVYMPAHVEGFEDRDMHRIIIGHNMRNGSMFSDLLKYKEKGFWEVTPYVYLYYPDRIEKWLIYSPFHTTQADEIYNMPYEAGTVLYRSLLDHVESSKLYDTATNGPTDTAGLLTLTTCDRNSTEGSDGRFVVNAKLADTSVIRDDSSTNGEASFDEESEVE